ncbi:MAG: hypothetical protein IJJ57_06205 [Ruminococcus sp.]|nr:hypothetical protein [Ruminococcus sp.]
MFSHRLLVQIGQRSSFICHYLIEELKAVKTLAYFVNNGIQHHVYGFTDRSKDCEIIDCICYLSEDEEFSFSVPIKKESIPVGIINDCLLGHDLRIRDISIDKKNRRLILVRYYKAIAREIITRKPNLLSYNKVMVLENYYIGMH